MENKYTRNGLEKLAIIAVFMAIWGVAYRSEIEHVTPDPVRPVDTVQVVADFFQKYEDSCAVQLRLYDETANNTYLLNYMRLDSTFDALIDKAGRELSPNDFEAVIVRVIDARNERLN